MNQFPTPLVSSEWLAQHVGDAQLKIVDASWHMPAAKRNATAEYRAEHIPTAVFFDIDANSDHSTDLPHMLPDAVTFSQAMNRLGISNRDAVVVYDSAGLFSAARLWWMLRVFGHKEVAILDGGLPKWKAEGYAVETGEITPEPADFVATFNHSLIRDKAALLHNLQQPNAHVLDARSAERFNGTAAEPRAGLRSGHIPSSENMPFGRLLNADGTLKSPSELELLLASALDKPVISSCGSGVTACIIDLALECIGHRNHAVYDGSWAEWGADNACPVTTHKEI